jgi:hypothetical protein
MQFGKGASFYSHEITFWIKLALTGVQGGLATFKTSEYMALVVLQGFVQSSLLFNCDDDDDDDDLFKRVQTNRGYRC